MMKIARHHLDAAKIRKMIEEKQQSLREFSYKSGISPERFSSILTGLENGYGVTEETAQKIARGLSVEIEDLLNDKGGEANEEI